MATTIVQPCVSSPELWFSTDDDLIEVAKRLCRSCPLLDPCTTLIAGLEADGHIEEGVWAGRTPKERNQRPRRVRKPVVGPRSRRMCVCLECGETDFHAGKGLCPYCYRRDWRASKRQPDTPVRPYQPRVTASVIDRALRMETAGMSRIQAARELGVSDEALQKAVERRRQAETLNRSA